MTPAKPREASTHLGRQHLLRVVQRAADFQNFIPQPLLALCRTSGKHHCSQSHPWIIGHSGSKGEKCRHSKQ